jgi:hypothetical protein
VTSLVGGLQLFQWLIKKKKKYNKDGGKQQKSTTISNKSIFTVCLFSPKVFKLW